MRRAFRSAERGFALQPSTFRIDSCTSQGPNSVSFSNCAVRCAGCAISPAVLPKTRSDPTLPHVEPPIQHRERFKVVLLQFRIVWLSMFSCRLSSLSGGENKSLAFKELMVGAAGFEPTTP